MKYLEKTATTKAARMVVDKVTEMKTIIYSAATAKKIDTEFLDYYIAAVEPFPEFEEDVINWIDDVNVYPVEDLTEEERNKFYSKRLRMLFVEKVEPKYSLEHLLKFLFKADWLLVYATLLDTFTFIPQE
jgi:hypothetical protein